MMAYIDLPPEAPLHTNIRPPNIWPSKGVVEFNDVSLRYYKYGPDVLSNITFKIQAGEKVQVHCIKIIKII